MERDRPGRRGRLPLSAALVVGVVALGLGLAGLLAPAPAQGQTLPTRTPPAPSARPSPSARPTLSGIRSTPTPPPGTPTPIASGSGSCELIVTDDDLAGPGGVRVVDAPLDGLPGRDPRYTYIRACEVIYTDESGQIVPNKTFDGPIEVCFRYTPEDVARAGGDPARLTVVYYDEASGQWVELEVVLDEAGGLVCGRLPRSGIVALAIRGGQLSGLPNTSGEIPEVTAAAAPAPAGGAAPAAAPPPAAPADAPAAAGQPAAAPAAPDTTAGAGAQAAAPGAAPAGVASVAPAEPVAGGGLAPVLALALGVVVAIGAVVVALSRNMITRARDE